MPLWRAQHSLPNSINSYSNFFILFYLPPQSIAFKFSGFYPTHKHTHTYRRAYTSRESPLLHRARYQLTFQRNMKAREKLDNRKRINRALFFGHSVGSGSRIYARLARGCFVQRIRAPKMPQRASTHSLFLSFRSVKWPLIYRRAAWAFC